MMYMGFSYSESETEGWGSRLGNSIVGVLVGVVLFIAGFPVLWWNEGNTVRNFASIDEGRRSVVQVKAESVDPANEGKLIHVAGLADTKTVLRDPQFPIAERALRLERKVEMYQWEEEKETKKEKNLGGSTTKTTTYTYDKKWTEGLIDSTNFKEKGHDNPKSMPFQRYEDSAKDAKLGAFKLGDQELGQLVNLTLIPVNEDLLRKAKGEAGDEPSADLAAAAGTPVKPTAAAIAKLAKQTKTPKAELPAGLKVANGMFYLGASPQTPAVGDVRVGFFALKPQEITVLAQQASGAFATWDSRVKGKSLHRTFAGTLTAPQVFEKLESEAKVIAWLFRALGVILLGVGVYLVLSPMGVLADVLPFMGDMVKLAAGMVAGIVALCLGSLTIGVAWIFYRPMLGIPLVAVSLAVLYMAWARSSAKRAAMA